VRVAVLGSLVLDINTPVGGARLRALLARLALDAGRAVSPVALVEALWTDADQLKALQSLVSRLRGVLGDAQLLTSGPAGYRLAVEPDAVDALRFERLARAGRHLLARSQPAEAAATLRTALGLWRGPALADVSEAPFAAAAAERLERARLVALEDRVDADLAVGTDLDLVAEIESLTAEHPLRERLHAQLIRALARDGRGAEALAAYQRIRGLLADRFGSDPGPQLQEAHLAVLRGDLRRSGPSRGNLDVPLTSFVGRDADVRAVVGLLGHARLVTLIGTGGAGKTRLANTVGRQLTPAGGVWFVPLAPVHADDVPRVVRDVLRAREPLRPVAPDEVMDHLVETLAGDDLVLVLDNCEHVIGTVATLAATLLGRCPRLRVLATSREPLRIDGETVHRVLPLEVPDPDSAPERARTRAAVRLFGDRAAAARPGFALDGAALTAAVEICRRLDGLPLAIELAAARLRTLPVEAVAARLDDRFRLLTRGSRTALPRQQTLRAAVAWSWDLLDADERALLACLSAVPGSFTEDAAAAISEVHDVSDALAALVEKSLLHPVEPADPVEPRYRVLETIRAYGLEQLAGVEVVRRRHAEFYVELAETADPHLRTSDQRRWLARLTAERDNLTAAIRWAIDSGDTHLAARFGAALCWFWFLRDHPPESVDLFGRMLHPPTLVVAAHALAIVDTGGPDEAEAALGRLTELPPGPGTHPVLDLARLAVALGTGRDVLASPDDRADPWSRALALQVRGVVAMNLGRTAEAADLLGRALSGFEEVGERWGLAVTLCTLHTALRRSGEPADWGLIERANRHFRELGLPDHSVESDVGAALHRARSGDVAGGRRDLTDLAARAATAESRALVHLGLARLEWRAGRPDLAREHALTGLSEAPPDRSVGPHLTTLLLAVLAQADVAAHRLDHPAVRLMLTVHTPVVAGIAAVVAAIELDRNRPERAARLLGFTTTLRGWDELVDVDPWPITQRAMDALGTKGFAAAHAAGAAMSRAEAEDLVTTIIAAPTAT
jgi:predicted ATPase/DNA-binding SARP family transcriptional activator